MSTNEVYSLSCFCESCYLDILQLSSSISAQGLPLQILMPDSDIDTALLLRVSFYRVAVIVDLACEASTQLLQMVTSTADLSFDWIYLRQPNITENWWKEFVVEIRLPWSCSNHPKISQKEYKSFV